MSEQEMPIFTRTFDFLTWLLPATNAFPRAHRPTATLRLLNAAFDLRERLEAANAAKGPARLALLRQADLDLGRVRTYLRLAVKWNWLSAGQYRHAAEMVTEIGRLLGGWLKVSDAH
jgi:hypothetical protein